ncbi:MFS transporter [Actinoplanes sp. NPDC051859]|uniref:MFS transporter n=1 Tax=Actinoplanes sp. NPDC051859 TaxID=3363909 RepID=UPI0037AB93D9
MDPRRVRLLVTVWAGQLVSLVGSSLTAFVLGVWVYQRTGSVSQFAMIFLASTLPAILAAPFAGVLADRWDRRRLMLGADSVAALATGAIAALYAADVLAVWHVYVTTAVGAAAGVLHQVSYASLTPRLVGKRHLARFNGMMQAGRAVQIAAPLLAGALVATIGVGGVLALDLGTFAVAATTLLVVRIPTEVTRPAGPESGAAAPSGSAWQAAAGWQHLRERPGLPALLVVFGVYNALFALAGVLVQPLILSFASAATLGALMFAGGAGLFAGSLLMSAWGGPRRRVTGIQAGLAVAGVALALHSLAPSPWLIAVVAPAFLFTLPVINTATMTLLQTKAESAVLGRVMATARVVGDAAVPLAYVAAGPLADRVAEPLMRNGGALAGGPGALLGTGPGRGIALIFAATGLAMLALAAIAYAVPSLRRVDDLPDAQDLDAAPLGAAEPTVREGVG